MVHYIVKGEWYQTQPTSNIYISSQCRKKWCTMLSQFESLHLSLYTCVESGNSTDCWLLWRTCLAEMCVKSALSLTALVVCRLVILSDADYVKWLLKRTHWYHMWCDESVTPKHVRFGWLIYQICPLVVNKIQKKLLFSPLPVRGKKTQLNSDCQCREKRKQGCPPLFPLLNCSVHAVWITT